MILRDDDIRSLLTVAAPLADPIGDMGPGKNSQIQAASLDLRVGGIYLPEAKHGAEGSIQEPLDRLDLAPGATAVVQTLETLKMPGDIAAIGFPPARVSSEGLLMTNPGHVDPGFKGPLSFTVINMGRKDYPLRRDNRIVTLVLFRLERAATNDWFSRTQEAGAGATEDMLSRLSVDFVNVVARADRIAKRRVRRSGLSLILVNFAVTVVAIVATFLVSYSVFLNRSNDDREAIARLEIQVERQASTEQLELRIDGLERQIEHLSAP
jgi:dCTP deaminase